jgi:hypothetical protein
MGMLRWPAGRLSLIALVALLVGCASGDSLEAESAERASAEAAPEEPSEAAEEIDLKALAAEVCAALDPNATHNQRGEARRELQSAGVAGGRPMFEAIEAVVAQCGEIVDLPPRAQPPSDRDVEKVCLEYSRNGADAGEALAEELASGKSYSVEDIKSRCGLVGAAEAYRSRGDEARAAEREQDRPETNRWPPSGFKVVGDGLALRKLDGSCGYLNCVAYEVVTRDGCLGGVYVEAQLLDAHGTVIGWTNDLLPSLRAGQVGELIMESTDDRASQVLVSDASCHR